MKKYYPDYEGAVAYALDRLQNELSDRYLYHSLQHTRDDVMPASIRLAKISGIVNGDIELLRIAAAYHDIGFLSSYQGHEITSARVAAQVLPGFGLDDRQVERVMGMIMATRLPQSPRDFLEMIIADADLDVLGREDFFERSELLRQERELCEDVNLSMQKWLQGQLEFLKTHSYFTEAARSLRREMKLEHIQSIMTRLDRNRHGVEIPLRQDLG